jgi:hypothetical protein
LALKDYVPFGSLNGFLIGVVVSKSLQVWRARNMGMDDKPLDLDEVRSMSNAELYALVRLCGKNLSKEELTVMAWVVGERQGAGELQMEIDSALKNF